MLSTHSLRTLNATVSQLPLCTILEAFVPNHVLCSNTIRLRKLVWADNLNETNAKMLSQAQAKALNGFFYDHGTLPPESRNIPQIVDPDLAQVFVPIFPENPTGKRQVFSLTPIPSSGLYHEIITREEEHQLVKLGMHQIEVNEASWSLHGDLVTEHKGVLKCFQLDDIDEIKNPEKKPADKKYLVMNFEVSDFNVAVGMIGVGLPSLTTIGTFITNFIQREANNVNHPIRFALGFQSINRKQPYSSARHEPYYSNHTGFHQPANNRPQNLNHTRRIGFKGVLVIETPEEEQLSRIYEILAQDFKLAGCPIFNKYLNITNMLPEAHWMHLLNDEVANELEKYPYKDVLDVFLDMHSEDSRNIIPVASGFALLEPTKVKASEIMNHAHAFTEVTYSAVELKHGFFNPKYLIQRKVVNEAFLNWES